MRHRTPTSIVSLCLALFCFAIGPSNAWAKDANPKPANPKDAEADKQAAPKVKPIPPLASDAEAEAALTEFKEAYKARGLKGDDKTSERDFAMQKIAPIQHRDVIKALAKVVKSKDPNLRIAAVVHLGEQRALPSLAGKVVADALLRSKKDVNFAITALETLGQLGYLGASPVVEQMLRHNDFSVKKAAIATVGQMKDMRLLRPMLAQVGINPDKDLEDVEKRERREKEDGHSWEGAEASVDTGTAGDGDQKAAEKQAKEQAAKNKAEAEAAAGGKPSIGRSGGGGGRSTKELIHPIKKALSAMTGESFEGPTSVVKWCQENKSDIATAIEKLIKDTKAQQKADKNAKPPSE